MAPTTTTLREGCAEIDNVIRVNDESGIAKGTILRIGDEELHVEESFVSGLSVPVLRARAGTTRAAHAAGATVTIEPYSALYDGSVFTVEQYADLRTRLEGLITEYVSAGDRTTATGKLHDILKRLPVATADVSEVAE